MTGFTPEMIALAKKAASVEELISVAAKNGVTLTQEEAAIYFAQLHPASHELSDDELDVVAGGGCYSPVEDMENDYGYPQDTMVYHPTDECNFCFIARNQNPKNKYIIKWEYWDGWTGKWQVLCTHCGNMHPKMYTGSPAERGYIKC